MNFGDDLFGPGPMGDPDRMAYANLVNPSTPASPAYASTEATLEPAEGLRALLDPQGSALFWIGLAAVLGLVFVTGQLKVSAVLRGGGGRRR